MKEMLSYSTFLTTISDMSRGHGVLSVWALNNNEQSCLPCYSSIPWGMFRATIQPSASPEPRVTRTQPVSSLMGHNPAVCKHSRQSPELVTSIIDSPSMSRNYPRLGSFQEVRSKRRQGKRQEWRQGCNMGAKSTQPTKPEIRRSIGPRDLSRK